MRKKRLRPQRIRLEQTLLDTTAQHWQSEKGTGSVASLTFCLERRPAATVPVPVFDCPVFRRGADGNACGEGDRHRGGNATHASKPTCATEPVPLPLLLRSRTQRRAPAAAFPSHRPRCHRVTRKRSDRYVPRVPHAARQQGKVPPLEPVRDVRSSGRAAGFPAKSGAFRKNRRGARKTLTRFVHCAISSSFIRITAVLYAHRQRAGWPMDGEITPDPTAATRLHRVRMWISPAGRGLAAQVSYVLNGGIGSDRISARRPPRSAASPKNSISIPIAPPGSWPASEAA